MCFFWHVRSALQLVAIRRSTGNDVSGSLFSPSFSSIPFHHFPVATFSHRRSALIKKLVKVVRSACIILEKWSQFFDFGVPRLVCLRGKANEKLLRSKNLFIAKVAPSAHITIEKWSMFFDLGVPRLRGKANKKLLGLKTLFSKNSTIENWSSFFLFGECKLTSAALKGVRRCRRWASAPAPLGWHFYSYALHSSCSVVPAL